MLSKNSASPVPNASGVPNNPDTSGNAPLPNDMASEDHVSKAARVAGTAGSSQRLSGTLPLKIEEGIEPN